MAVRLTAPPVDRRRARALAAQLRGSIPYYTPEWPAADPDDPGRALLEVFSLIAEGVIRQLNLAPHKNFIEFLNLLGIQLLPARPGRAPLHFRLASGLEQGVRVPAGTRATAPPVEGRTEELPFETLEDLLATPSSLKALVGVDPSRDAIFTPPANFLKLERAAEPLPRYQLASFSNRGSKLFQLDRVDDLEEGDFLRMGSTSGAAAASQAAGTCSGGAGASDRESPEYLMIESVDQDGRLVHVSEELTRDYPAGSEIEKVTDFAVFQSKNLQEHTLYLGHTDLFNVKSPVRFEIRVLHLAGTDNNLQPLAAAWEYWSDDESGEAEAWREFSLEADGSAGFSQNGVVVLAKPEGEIKQREINGVESRWIRARLTQSVPGSPPPKLPTLDQITFLVKSFSADSAGKEFTPDVTPDLIFHNDTQLELPEFHPFGTEPRLFDRFYVGSQEVLSKKGARIQLAFQLKEKGIIASPAAVQFEGTVRALAKGTAGRLFDVVIQADPGQTEGSQFEPHPEFNTVIAPESAPAVTTDESGSRLYVFVRGRDGQLYERFYNGQVWGWIPLGVPKQGANEVDRIIFDPAVALEETPLGVFPRVFVVGESKSGGAPARNLYSARIKPSNGVRAGNWRAHNLTQIDSSPTAVSRGDILHVFACEKSGRIQQLTDLQANWSPVADGNHPFEVGPDPRGRDEDESISDSSPSRLRPFALLYEVAGMIVARVAAVDTDGRLQEAIFDSATSQWTAFDPPAGHDRPAPDIPAVSAPTGIILDPGTDHESRYFFVRGADDHLWERRIRMASNAMIEDDWIDRDRAGNADLRQSPQAVFHHYQETPSFGQGYLSVFSGNRKNFLAEFRQQLQENGRAQGGPNRTLVLDPGAASVDDAYRGRMVYIDSGSGEDDEFRPIAAYGGDNRVILLDDNASPWNPLPNANSTYRIVRAVHQASAVAVGADSIQLDNTASGFNDVVVGLEIRIDDGQIRTIDAVSADGTVQVNTDWAPTPGAPPDYLVFEVIREGAADQAGVTAQNIVLDDDAVPQDGRFEGAQILIEGGAGAPQGPVTIDAYSGSTRIAQVNAAWATDPNNSSLYRIVGPLGGSWRQYENPRDLELRPELSWEYWNSSGWVRLRGTQDNTQSLLVSDKVTFRLPDDIDQTDVAGQENYWVRARITNGDYGRETFTTITVPGVDDQLVVNKDNIQPPFALDLKIGYELVDEARPERCLTFNNLNYVDQTAACRTPRKQFSPFLSLGDEALTVYLGFDKAVQGGPTRLLVVAEELAVDDSNPPKLQWSFRSGNRWIPIQADDATEALVKQEILTLNIPAGFQSQTLFGQSAYWIRGKLVKGDYLPDRLPVLRGVFLNAARAHQAQTVTDEILGSSDGEENQEFEFFTPGSLIGDPEIRVREVLSLEELEELRAESGEEAILDREELGETQTWVLWSSVHHFFGSHENSRHYILDRARRRIRFGDGERGLIPPGGTDNIRAFRYQAGGGAQGNVGVGEVNALTSAVAGTDSVLNPVEAGGGSDAADVEEMLRLGPAQISTRGRAVTAEDFEWLALEASRVVAKARCLPNTDAQGRRRAGWITVYIVPDSKDRFPRPSLALRRAVREYLEARCEVPLKAAGRIVVAPPRYVPVSVEADIFADTLNDVARVELAVDARLEQYLHPLTGGDEGRGWEFGRDVAASDLYVELEAIEGVDHVENLVLHFGEERSSELATIPADALPAKGDNQVRVRVAEGG